MFADLLSLSGARAYPGRRALRAESPPSFPRKVPTIAATVFPKSSPSCSERKGRPGGPALCVLKGFSTDAGFGKTLVGWTDGDKELTRTASRLQWFWRSGGSSACTGHPAAHRATCGGET